MAQTREAAEILAIKALRWLLSNDELLPVFLGSSGASLEDLRANAGEPELLGAVLDFLLMDDAWLSAFCAEEGIDPAQPATARAMLAGGDSMMHWT